MIKNFSARIVLLLIALTLFNVQDGFAQASNKQTIGSSRFKKKMKQEEVVVLDVRTAEEYNSGHIPGALNIDVKQDDFLEQINKLDKSKTYLLYCRSAKRSAKALGIMESKGFNKLFHLKGGILKWKGKQE